MKVRDSLRKILTDGERRIGRGKLRGGVWLYFDGNHGNIGGSEATKKEWIGKRKEKKCNQNYVDGMTERGRWIP